MPQTEKKERTVPPGKALDWSEEDLDALSEITPADIESAKQAYRKDAPLEYRTLLDAEPADDAL